MYDNLKDPVFLNELSKIIGHDWKILGHHLSINENDLEIIDYTNEKVRMKAYEMLTKFLKKSLTLKDIRNALLIMEKLDLVKEIDRLTKKSEKDNSNLTGELVRDNANSCGKLERDSAVYKQPIMQIRDEIKSLFKQGINAILSFDASDTTIDKGVAILNNVINRITHEPNYETDEDFLKMLRSSFEIIGDIYTAIFKSKFQGNNYKNKTQEKYKIAIDAYEKCFEYNRYLRSHYDYNYNNIFNKLVQKLDKPTYYGYDASVRDASKYEKYYNQFTSGYLYEKGKSCLQDKDFKNAIFFFEEEISQPSCSDTQGSSYIQVAMILQYYHDKTKQTFYKSVEYYNKAIAIFLNRDEINCAGDLTDCLFHLYALLSDPATYMFDSSLAIETKSKEVFDLKEQYINDKADRLYIQAKIYACKRFSWMNDKKDNLNADKVLEYCRRALQASDKSVAIITKLYFLMAYTYSTLMVKKDLSCYRNAIACCQEALKTYLSHSNQEYAERVVTMSITLAYIPETKGFQNISGDDTKPLRDLLKDIYESNNYKINGYKEMWKSYNCLNIQDIHVCDPFLLERQSILFKDMINNKTIANSKEYKDSIEEEKKNFNSTKSRLAQIEKNQELYWYYYAFHKTLSECYATAVLVKSGKVVLDKSTLSSKLASLILGIVPLIPNIATETVTNVLEYFESVEMIHVAINTTNLAVSQTQFDNMVEDVIVSIIFENQNLILAKKSQIDAMKWYDEFINLCKKVYNKFDEKIYGDQYPKDMHKLGNKDATRTISNWISSGIIYGENNGASLLPDDKKQRLKNAVYKEVVNSGNDVTDATHNPTTEVDSFDSNEPEKKKCCCCHCCCCKHCCSCILI
ncbi:uncharacterized protein LOC105846737 isoform X2 [Hydra vulgaris]|uniref:Uncharacterized protein LOC105846737 isoform X2 n=1 Tax=Hydra vulgaris TaxID=6087 RepID=A0ABM4DFC4_HYDVU